MGFILTNTYYQLVTKEMNDEKNVAVAQEITKYIEASPDVNLEHYLSSFGHIGYQIYVVGESGYSQFIGDEFADKELPDSAREMVFSGQIYHGMKSLANHFFMTGIFANELKNTVGLPFQYQGEQYGIFLRPNNSMLVTEVHVILIVFIGSMGIISLIAMLFIAKQLTSPIAKLTEATKHISQENYDHLLTIQRRDEIGQLAESFNEMTRQLQENDRSRKEFISNVSHDFQSPLFNIQGYAELLKSETLTEEERITFTSIIETEAKRLSTLTKQLLLLTSLDQSTRRLKRSVFSIDQQLKSLSHKYLWRMEELGIEVYYKTSPVRYEGDESLLETVWDNLFTNALKYNKPHGSIQIELKDQGEYITICFEDTGIGLREEELPHVFERFYRTDSSRTTEGTGLGLAIVKQVVELYSGKIEIRSSIGEGTKVLITLPRV